MNWFRNAKFRNKFLFAFSIPLIIVSFLSIYASVKIRNVESAFVELADGPNRRIVYASDAIAELANCRRYILAMGYMYNDSDYVNTCYESYKSSSMLIMRCLDDYYLNLINDSFLHDYEIENRESIVSGIKEIFTGAYQENVEELYKASLAKDQARMKALVAEGLPMGDEMTDTLWMLRSIVQDHLDYITNETHEYTNRAVLTLIFIALGLIILSVIVSLLMSDMIRVPIVEIEMGMSEIARGNLLYPIRSKYKDELGVLSNRIGDMVDTISMLNKAVVIVDSVDELILVTDLEYNLLFVNNKLEELYGVTRDSCLGKKCYNTIYGIDAPCHFCTLPAMSKDKNSFPSAKWERKDNISGKEICIAGNTSIVRWVDGSLAQISTGKDDTLRIKHEEQQKRHAEELREAALAAEEASRAKSIFLASMSHEIRTPMNAVMGLSELILRARKNLPSEVYENALAIKGASQNLLSIINDLLDLSKIESGKLEIIESNYEFSSLVNDMISIVRVRLSEKPILFVVDIDPHIPEFLIGDEVRIRQTILNLLSNAVKYTIEGCVALRITGEVNMEEGRVLLTIEVSDSGIGIKDEDIENLFDEFVRIDTEKNRAIEGTGLGLPISLKLCEAMGGGITVHSEYGKGSTFTATLPQKFSEYHPAASIENPNDKFILLFEPSILHRTSIENAFKALGIRYETAENISWLLDNVERFSHVFVNASECNGVIQHLRGLKKPPDMTVLTGFTDAPAYKGARVIDLPAYSLSIANVLNNKEGGHFDLSASNETFIAPEANILIVDDMMSNLLVAKGLMSPYEMNITTCSNGEEAVALVSCNRYDLVFMDHMMPKMDGLEATKLIRAMDGEYFSALPIVALTANAVSGMREMFLKSGMNDFLAKPIETLKLNSILEKWIPANKRMLKKATKESEIPSAEEGTLLKTLRALPDLSIDEAVDLMGNSPETYEDVFKISVRLLPTNVSRLNEFINTDLKSYEVEVHGVKGVLGNIGAYEIRRAAYELEMLSKSGNTQACKELHPGFIERLTAFIDKTTAIIEEMAPEDKPEGNKANFLGVFAKISESVEYYNAAEALEILSSMCEYTYGQTIDEAALELERALEYFDFDSAAVALKALKGALESDE